MHIFVLCNKHVFLKAEKIFGSHEKAALWFEKSNPNLHGNSPLKLISSNDFIVLTQEDFACIILFYVIFLHVLNMEFISKF